MAAVHTRPPAALEHKSATLADRRTRSRRPAAAPARVPAPAPSFDLTDDPEGTAWCIVAVTGVVDDVDDVIVPGAFRRSLIERKMRGVLGHDWNRQVAVQRDALELLPGDPRLPATLADGVTPWPSGAGALLVKAAYILGTRDGHDAWVQAQANGRDQQYSIGYRVQKSKARNGCRYIYDLDVYEFSPVLHGANRLATLQAVKSAARAGIEGKGAQVHGRRIARPVACGACGRPAAASTGPLSPSTVVLCGECLSAFDDMAFEVDPLGLDDPDRRLFRASFCANCNGPAGGTTSRSQTAGSRIVCLSCQQLGDQLAVDTGYLTADDLAAADAAEDTSSSEVLFEQALREEREWDLSSDGEPVPVSSAATRVGRAWRRS